MAGSPEEGNIPVKDKLKFAFYWTGSCGGCEVAVLDLDDKILDLLKSAEIVFWPVAIDIKYSQLEEFPDGHIDLCFINGIIRNTENEKISQLLRKKSRTVVAFGSCSCFGSVVGMANLYTREEILKTVYENTLSTVNPERTLPQTNSKVNSGELLLPAFLPKAKTLSEIIEVDYFLPGCPPPVTLIETATQLILTGKLPQRGAVIASNKSVCDECKKEKQDKDIKEIKRVFEFGPGEIDSKKCLLEQGIICMGPATRAGCEAPCTSADMPCSGCLGPCENVHDQGAKMISALASVLRVSDEEKISPQEMECALNKIPDLVGTFYKYTYVSSLLGKIADGGTTYKKERSKKG